MFFCFHLQGTQTFTTYEEKGWCTNSTTIYCYEEGKEIGSVELLRLPFSFYVAHSFYVHPDYRNQGVGRALIAQVCLFLKTNGAYKTYAQPGPFELKEGELGEIPDKTEYQEKMKKLVALYRSVGFCSVHPITSTLVGFAYSIVRMSQDASYLMVMQ